MRPVHIAASELWTQLGNAVGPIIVGLVIAAAAEFRGWWDKRKARSTPVSPPIEATFEWDVRIHDQLERCRIALDPPNGVARAYVSQFHNGEYYDSSNHMQKKTRTHEVVREGLAYQEEQFKGALCSTMVDEMGLVIEDGPAFRLVRDLPKGKFKWLCQRGGVTAVARCAIRNSKRQIIAFIGVDYDWDFNEELAGGGPRRLCPPANIDLLCDYAGQIEQLL